jgi:hypothetical protein
MFWSMSKPHALAGGLVPFEIDLRPTILCDDATYALSGTFRTKINEHVNAAGGMVTTVVQIPNGMVAEDGDGNTFRVVGVIHAQGTLNENTGRGQGSITTLLRIVGRGGGIAGTVWTVMHIDAAGVVESSDNGTCSLSFIQPFKPEPITNCIDFLDPKGCSGF